MKPRNVWTDFCDAPLQLGILGIVISVEEMKKARLRTSQYSSKDVMIGFYMQTPKKAPDAAH